MGIRVAIDGAYRPEWNLLSVFLKGATPQMYIVAMIDYHINHHHFNHFHHQFNTILFS